MEKTKYGDDIRRIRTLSRDFIIEFLTKHPATSNQIIDGFKVKFKRYCNDEIMCKCQGGVRKSPEWKHQVLWGIQDVKRSQNLAYDKQTRFYSILK